MGMRERGERKEERREGVIQEREEGREKRLEEMNMWAPYEGIFSLQAGLLLHRMFVLFLCLYYMFD